MEDVFFIIIGSGTEYGKLEAYANSAGQPNLKLLRSLPKEDYDTLVGACDVRLIFLDHRFTIPNFPSRLLSYMQAKLPVLACTDPNTDVGKVITEGGFGWWCESDNSEKFIGKIQTIIDMDVLALSNNAFMYLNNNYTSGNAYQIIVRSIS